MADETKTTYFISSSQQGYFFVQLPLHLTQLTLELSAHLDKPTPTDSADIYSVNYYVN